VRVWLLPPLTPHTAQERTQNLGAAQHRKSPSMIEHLQEPKTSTGDIRPSIPSTRHRAMENMDWQRECECSRYLWRWPGERPRSGTPRCAAGTRRCRRAGWRAAGRGRVEQQGAAPGSPARRRGSPGRSRPATTTTRKGSRGKHHQPSSANG
jgi:hypothetical protein